MNWVLESGRRPFFGCFQAKRWASGGAGLMRKWFHRAASGSEMQPFCGTHCTSSPSGAHLVDGRVNLMTGKPRCVTILSFPTSFVSCLTSVSSHRSPERPPPKHSFLFTCCAWFPYPVPTCLLWMSFSYTRLPQRRLFPSIAPPKPSVYIHHSSYATNTAWSVHYIVTYLRRPHCMYSP